MTMPLDEIYDRAEALADSPDEISRYDAIREVLGIPGRDPEIWAVEWQGRIQAEEWQTILTQHVATELESRAHGRRVYIPDDEDEYDPKEFEADVVRLVEGTLGAWEEIKYQDQDHVARTLSHLSRDWYATGQADVAAGYRRVRIGEFKNEVHDEMIREDVFWPKDLAEETQKKCAALADDVWPRNRKAVK